MGTDLLDARLGVLGQVNPLIKAHDDVRYSAHVEREWSIRTPYPRS